MKLFLNILQIILSIFLIALILLQPKGTGLGSFGGSLGVYSTKRGVEKAVFILTILIAFLFFLSSFFQLLSF